MYTPTDMHEQMLCIYIYACICIYMIMHITMHIHMQMQIHIYICIYTDIDRDTWLYKYTQLSIHGPGSRFADPHQPPMVSPTHPLPKPNLCDCTHFLHMRAPKPSSVTRIASQRRSIRDSHVRPPKPSSVTKEKVLRHAGLTQGNCHEDRVP